MIYRKLIPFVICFILAGARASSAAEKPVPAIEHVLIISIDGLRPDILLRANTPRMHKLLDEGSFTMWAKTTPVSITLPSHVSMMTGVPPEVHGIMWNSDLPLSQPVYPASATLFKVAKHAGITTGMSAGKKKFDIFDEPGALDWKFIPTVDLAEDEDVASHAIEIIRSHQPGVMFVHFGMVDGVGHARGWGSPEQIAAVENADMQVGKLLDLLTEMKLIDSTFILVTADHGGAGRTHGPEDPRSRTIPWIVVGPGIRKNFDLTRLGKEIDIETYDTFATACAMLAISPPRHVTGKFVRQILDGQELVMPGKPPSNAPATKPMDGG